MRLLVLRTSAMGDVALLTPVIRGFEEQYKDIKILLVTGKAFGSFFRASDNLELFFPDFKGRHKGLIGIFCLFRDIRKKGKIDHVVDLHDVTRTKILRLLFRIAGIGGGLNIGIAPYSKHLLKMWPEDYMVELLGKISERHEVRFWLFGGIGETDRLRLLQQKIPGSFLTTRIMTLDEELALIKRLSFMISMDSSKLHMASLAGAIVVSIWGATDPATGFGAWGQPEEYFIRIPVDELTCRPCTVYGMGTCRRGDHACMRWLTPELVFEKLLN